MATADDYASTRTQPVADLRPGRAGVDRRGHWNVLFVMSDQERGWHLYPDGFIDRHTPARAWLREHGVTFTNFHTPTPICSTSRGVIYTGLHSMNNGVFDNTPLPYASPLRPDVATMGSAFVDAGYITGYAGKWHLSRIGHVVTDDGERAANNATVRSYGFLDTEFHEEVDGALAGWSRDAHTVDRAARFIARHAGDARPWMLAVNLVNPHDVMFYTTGDEMTASRAGRFPDVSARPPADDPLYADDLGYDLTEHYGPATFGERPGAVEHYRLAFEEAMGHMPYDDLDAGREMQNYYWNCTRDSDRHLQTLLDALRASGEADRTVIVFTSDHGEMLGTHGMRGKGTTAFRETASVPAVVVHPAGRRGVARDAVLSHVDWLPTLLALAGVPAERVAEQLPGLAGIDASPLVFDDAASLRREGVLLHWTSLAFMEHRNVRKFEAVRSAPPEQRPAQMLELLSTALVNRSQMRGVFDGRWKFQRYGSPLRLTPPTTFDELIADWDFDLYDTHTDPGECHNLAVDRERWRDRITELNATVNELIESEVGVDDPATYNPLVALNQS
jgi:arylsulfatase A-like enzyme